MKQGGRQVAGGLGYAGRGGNMGYASRSLTGVADG